MNDRKTPHPFGRYIRRMREAAGLSQYQVAQQIDVRAQYLSQVERGERGPMTTDRCESLASAIPGVNEKTLWQIAIASRPAMLKVDPDHPDHGLVVRLAEVIRSQVELSPAQRTGIMNILSVVAGLPPKRNHDARPVHLNNNQIWGISSALLHHMAHHIRALETDKDEQSRHDRQLAIDACISAQAAMATSDDHYDPR